MADHLFIMGLGRSGTTVLAQVLNQHGEIAMGMERFKKAWPDLSALTPAHFTRERFFDFSDEMTNIAPWRPEWRDYYARIDEKFDRVRYVGDKITNLFVLKLLTSFPQGQVVVIARDLAATAASWDARAKNPADVNWPAKNDGVAAIRFWNDALHKTIRAVSQHPGQVHVVEYERVFSDPEATSLRRLSAALGLEWDEGIDTAFSAAHAIYAERIVGKVRRLDDDLQARIDRDADTTAWKAVLDLTL
ncbi:sulfotransferase family protein [Promicromonospora panici]|uniref:sulfotransferase family protein n=1 Tax=Promicromonospora panici TaxID=2219658 RepID=UPI0013EDBC71|nr:sulfotransferase [Promicromonospora panici]